MSKTELREAVGFSTATLAQMSKDQNVSMEVLNKICNYLDVPIEQVIKQVKESK
jgi:DNA-binding Xre family transcriptional regulator